MIKIRSLYLTDFEKIEALHATLKEKIVYLAQPLIFPNLRFLPSVHVAAHEKNILGYIVLRCASKLNNSWKIDEVFVFDEMRNKGIGEELLRYVLSLYGGFGIEHFLAEVDSENTPALSLFHNCGFRRYAKVCYYQKEIDIEAFPATGEALASLDASRSGRQGRHETPLLDRDFILRPQTKNDLAELEKLELSSIPPDLRPALGRSKEYFKDISNSIVLNDKSRNLIVGWAQIQKPSKDNFFIELIASPGWTHLYEQFLNTIICDFIAVETNKLNLTVKVNDYLTDLTDILTRAGFLKREVKELLVRTIWQKVKERKLKTARGVVPRAAPT